jgi:DNA-directed RNA polymerase specialized sigma24 family protein
MPNQNSPDFASSLEVAQALTDMSTADLLRLKQSAKLRSFGLTAVDWEDLISEAISRTLAGSRRWPRSIPFVAFLMQTVRSVASEEWRRLQKEQVTTESQLMAGDMETPIAISDLAITLIHPEREAIARHALKEIEMLFNADSEALEVLHGLAKGMTPSEVQSEANLTPIQYASAQKRIRRCLARNFLTGDQT